MLRATRVQILYTLPLKVFRGGRSRGLVARRSTQIPSRPRRDSKPPSRLLRVSSLFSNRRRHVGGVLLLSRSCERYLPRLPSHLRQRPLFDFSCLGRRPAICYPQTAIASSIRLEPALARRSENRDGF